MESVASIAARSRPAVCAREGAPVTMLARWSLSAGDAPPGEWTDYRLRAPASDALSFCQVLVDAEMLRILRGASGTSLKVRLERACAPEPLPPRSDAEPFSIVREEAIPAPESLLLGAGVGASCFGRRTERTDAGEGTLDAGIRAPLQATAESAPDADSYSVSLTLARGSTFPDGAQCERFRAQLAAERAGNRAAGTDWLRSQLARAEEELAQEEADARELAETKGSAEALAKRQRDARQALDAARASGDRARVDRATEQAMDVNARQLESDRLTRAAEHGRSLVALLRRRIEEEADSGAAPAVEACVRSQ